MKIGRKLALASGAGMLQLVFLAGLSIWALNNTNSAADKAQDYAHKLNQAVRIEGSLSEIAMRMSNLPVAKQIDREADRILALRKESPRKIGGS